MVDVYVKTFIFDESQFPPHKHQLSEDEFIRKILDSKKIGNSWRVTALMEEYDEEKWLELRTPKE